MEKSNSNKVSSLLYIRENIKRNEHTMYKFITEVLLILLFTIAIIISLGTVFDKLGHYIVFSTSYVLLRRFTGGCFKHNYSVSMFKFILILLITIFVDEYGLFGIDNGVIVLFSFLCFVGIFLLTPVQYKSELLKKNEKILLKYKARLIASIIILGVSATSNIVKYNDYTIYLGSVLFWVFILLNIGIINRHRR